MKIEITKKQLIVAVITIAVLALSFTGGYFIGFDNGVESMQNPKGDGSHFYSESFDENMKGTTSKQCDVLLYHSTLECPNIRFGTERDEYGYYKTWGKTKVPYIFCPKCMDNELINICERKIISAYPDDVKN